MLNVNTYGVPPALVKLGVQQSAEVSVMFRPDPKAITRTVVVYGESATDITSGGSCTLTAFRKDFDDTYITALNFVTLATNIVTFTQPGFYALTYHASAQIVTAFVPPQDVDITTAKFTIKVGGTELAGTSGYISAQDTMDLSGFLTVGPGNTLEQSADMDGITSTSPTYGTIEVPQGTGADNVATWSADATVLYSETGIVTTTTDTGQSAPVTSNAEVYDQASGPEGFYGSASNATVIEIRYNPSNVLKAFIGGTEYDPTVVIFGAKDSGSRNITNTNTTLHITKLT